MDYEEYTIKVLRDKLEERGLPRVGLKTELVVRLKSHDTRRQFLQSPQAEPRPSPPKLDQFATLSDSELDLICRENHVDQDIDDVRQRAYIEVEYGIQIKGYEQKCDMVIRKANLTIEQTRAKQRKKVAKAELEREEKLKELEDLLEAQTAKKKVFGLAYQQLQLRKGVAIRKTNFDAPNSQSREQVAKALATRQPSQQIVDLTSANTSTKRRATSPTMASSGEKKPRHENRSESLAIPPRPNRVEIGYIRGQFTDSPYIFISGRNIKLLDSNISKVRLMLVAVGFAVKQVRADQRGYYIVFENSAQGEAQAQSCIESSQGKPFDGTPVMMELSLRGVF